jgi:hypothetical protein
LDYEDEKYFDKIPAPKEELKEKITLTIPTATKLTFFIIFREEDMLGLAIFLKSNSRLGK